MRRRPPGCVRPANAKQENAAALSNVKGGVVGPETVHGEQKFSEVIKTLPELYPESRLRELSVPFCFICLLHLANEKNLAIAGSPDLTELRVRQNGPLPVGLAH